MKNCFILPLLFAFTGIFGQTYWEELTPLRDVENTADVFFPTNARGYYAGVQKGTILRTDNSGASWTRLRLPQTISSNFHEMCFLNKDTGFFVGTASYSTKNGCNSYTAITTSISNMQSVWFTSVLTGYMAGTSGKIYKTTDMGGSWNLLASGTTEQLNSIHFANADTGLAVGNNGIVVRTTDGGTSWNTINIPTTSFLESVQFINDSTAYIVGDYAGIYVSTNAGATWATVATPFTGNSFTFYRLRFFNSHVGYAVGTSNSIAFTADGGQTWSLSGITGYTNSFYAVAFRPDGTAFLGGVGKVWQTSDYANWKYNMIGVAQSTLNDITFVNSDTGFACGYGGSNGDTYQTLMRTTDKGKLWTSKAVNNDFSGNGFHALAFTSANKGYALAYSNVSLTTANCGSTWSALSSFTGLPAPNDVQFFNTNTGYACGGGIQVTTNAGASWTSSTISGAPALTALSFPNPNLGYVCGLSGKVYKTTNACATWTNVSPPTGLDLSSISFPTDSIGYVVGSSTACYKTTNGGTSWNTTAGGSGVKLVFIDKDTGYVVSNYGILRKTVNGGQTFTTVLNALPNPTGIRGATLVNNSFYTVGQSGGVFRHVLGCVSPPQLTAAISGVATSCVNQTDTFSLPAIGGVIFQWDSMYGAQITAALAANKIAIQWQLPGIFYVKASISNACGTSETVMYKVTVNPLPATPVITQSGNMLVCNYTTGVQWYLNGAAIPGATNDTLPVSQNGAYTVVHTDLQSCSNSSSVYNFFSTGINALGLTEQIFIYPNPAAENITVTASSFLTHIAIYDLAGRKLKDCPVPAGLKSYSLNPDVSAGSYFIIVSTIRTISTQKLVKTNE